MERIIRYFNLQSQRMNIIAQAHAAGEETPEAVLPQYIALVLGIIVQPFLNYYIEHGQWLVSVGGLVGRIFGLIMGVLILPGVYKAAFDPGKPGALQYCALFSSGIGWQSLIQGGARAALGLGPS